MSGAPTRILLENYSLAPQALIETCMECLAEFLQGMTLSDDLTMMAIRRVDESV
jgi:serine phosphatase RsbU (regulator of sigma subunit)